jgi:hypothetical protein
MRRRVCTTHRAQKCEKRERTEEFLKKRVEGEKKELLF